MGARERDNTERGRGKRERRVRKTDEKGEREINERMEKGREKEE